jgi:hypothetical protein
MKKLFVLIMAIIFISGCAGMGLQTDSRITALEQKMAKMEKRSIMDLATGAGANFYPARGIDGGAAGDLDKIASPTIGDIAFVVLNEDALYGNAMFVYVYTDFGAAVAQNLPYEVKPVTGSSANYAWTLASSSVAPPVVISSTPWTLTLGEARAGTAQMTVTGTVNLPAAATVGFGSMWCVFSRDAEVMTIDPNGTEKININGVASAAGVSVTSDGAVGDFGCFIAVTDTDTTGTDGWWQLGYGKTAWQ